MNDWLDRFEVAVAAGDAVWTDALLRVAPEGAIVALADVLDRSVHYGRIEIDVAGYRRALAALMAAAGDDEAIPAAEGRDTAWWRAAAFLDEPARWDALLAATPGDGDVARAQRVLLRLLLRGVTFEAVLQRVGRRGPVAQLDAIAKTGLLSQFDFQDRRKRIRRPETRARWTALAVYAAQARGHDCCAYPLMWELEEHLRVHLGLTREAAAAQGWPVDVE